MADSSKFDLFDKKMRAEGLSDAAVDAFRHNYQQLVEGVTGMVRHTCLVLIPIAATLLCPCTLSDKSPCSSYYGMQPVVLTSLQRVGMPHASIVHITTT